MADYQVNEHGYYGKFGGAYIPEMLFHNIEELKTQYLKITASERIKYRKVSQQEKKSTATQTPC